MPRPPWTPDYILAVQERAEALASDGCSGVPDFYLDACREHDVHYRTHAWLDGSPITKDEADCTFQARIREMSLWGVFSPMAFWRYWALRWFGHTAWSEAPTLPRSPS